MWPVSVAMLAYFSLSSKLQLKQQQKSHGSEIEMQMQVAHTLRLSKSVCGRLVNGKMIE